MTVRSRDYLKARFETNDTPSQDDFQDLIDSMVIVGEDYVVHDDAVVVHDDALVTLT